MQFDSSFLLPGEGGGLKLFHFLLDYPKKGGTLMFVMFSSSEHTILSFVSPYSVQFCKLDCCNDI